MSDMTEWSETGEYVVDNNNISATNLARFNGKTWTMDTLSAEFVVIGFHSPFLAVRRRADGVVGTLEYTSRPRVYFDFREAPNG